MRIAQEKVRIFPFSCIDDSQKCRSVHFRNNTVYQACKVSILMFPRFPNGMNYFRWHGNTVALAVFSGLMNQNNEAVHFLHSNLFNQNEHGFYKRHTLKTRFLLQFFFLKFRFSCCYFFQFDLLVQLCA